MVEVLTREKLELAAYALARVLRAVLTGDREQCQGGVSRALVELAVQLIIRASSASAQDALQASRLQGLGAVNRGGVVWVQGRVRGEDLARLLGMPELPVIHNNIEPCFVLNTVQGRD